MLDTAKQSVAASDLDGISKADAVYSGQVGFKWVEKYGPTNIGVETFLSSLQMER